MGFYYSLEVKALEISLPQKRKPQHNIPSGILKIDDCIAKAFFCQPLPMACSHARAHTHAHAHTGKVLALHISLLLGYRQPVYTHS